MCIRKTERECVCVRERGLYVCKRKGEIVRVYKKEGEKMCLGGGVYVCKRKGERVHVYKKEGVKMCACL